MLRPHVAALTVTFAAGALALAAIPTVSIQEPVEPTAQHKMLARGVGEWEGTLTLFLPGREPIPTPATEKVEALGPLWTTSHIESEVMGTPFAAKGCLGYDVGKGRFVGTWIDTMDTDLTVMEGEYDQAEKALVMRWEEPDMTTGDVVVWRSETVRGADTYLQTIFVGAGEGSRLWQIEMTRKAAEPADDDE